MRKLFCLLLVAAFSIPAAEGRGYDLLWLKGRRESRTVIVVDVTLSDLHYKIVTRGKVIPSPQRTSHDRLRKWAFDRDSKPYDYQAAEEAMQAGNYRKAIGVFRRAVNGGEGEAWVKQYSLYLIARCHENLGDTPGAMRAYADLLEQVPTTYFFAPVHLRLGRTYLERAAWSKAGEAFQALVEKAEKGEISKRYGFEGEYWLARSLEAQGKTAEARAGYDKVAGRAGRYRTLAARARIGHARCRIVARDFSGAEGDLRRVVAALKSEDRGQLAESYNALGQAQMGSGDFKGALRSFLRNVVYYRREEFMAESLWGAARCFYRTHKDVDPKLKDLWLARADGFARRLKNEFPSARFPSYKN